MVGDGVCGVREINVWKDVCALPRACSACARHASRAVPTVETFADVQLT